LISILTCNFFVFLLLALLEKLTTVLLFYIRW